MHFAKDIIGIAHGQYDGGKNAEAEGGDENNIDLSSLPIAEISAEYKMKRMKQGLSLVGKEVYQGYVGIHNLDANISAGGELELGRSKRFAKYEKLITTLSINGTKIKVFTDDLNIQEDTSRYRIVRKDDKLLFRWNAGNPTGSYEGKIEVINFKGKVKGCYLNGDKLVLKTDKGDINADDIDGFSA
jgi:hypothetical protein